MAGNVSSKLAEKAALRKDAEGRRRALSPEVVQRWGGEVQRHLAALLFPGGRDAAGRLAVFSDRVVRAVAVYDAQNFEVPLADFVLELSSRGVQCVYPRVVKGTRELVFHHVADDQWAKGPFGIREPASHSPVRGIQDIDVFIVPGVAFTRDGRRLGRGAGYYDSTLALRNPHAQMIGVAFECNVVEAVPTEPHDVSVNFLVTERGVFATRRQ